MFAVMNELPQNSDVVFVGAGHNALVAAAYLLEADRSVTLLEQMERPGGWVRTEELGAPGFLHDRWSSLHPAFVGGPAWAELGPGPGASRTRVRDRSCGVRILAAGRPRGGRSDRSPGVRG